MILDELSIGMRDCYIIEKLQIPHMTYYRYINARYQDKSQISNQK
jgi:hypothetical protein